MEDDITFTCPCCNSTLGLDDTGDLFAIEDNRPGASGINGIRTVTVGGNQWTQDRYLASEPQQYQIPIQMREPGRAGKPAEPNPELMEAHKKDLKERNIH